MVTKDFGEIICVDCGQTTKKHGPVQKYCGICSEKHDLVRKAKWATANPRVRTLEDNQQRYGEHKTNLSQRGKAIAAQNVRGIAWLDEGPELAWSSRFKYPYSQAVSKNHIYSNTRRGHVFMRSESTKAKDDIALLARVALGGRKLKNNKVWIDF